MRLGLLADVHGNLPALRRVLDLLAEEDLDTCICAGDLVGYGPHPNECIEAVDAGAIRCVAGNHDLIATSQLSPEGIGSLARRSLVWTARELRPRSVGFIRDLPARTEVGSSLVAHGSLDDPSAYVGPDGAHEQLERLAAVAPSARLLVLGHTHRPFAYGLRSGLMIRERSGSVVACDSEPVLVNPGSVGQSRERRVVARFAVVDMSTGRIDLRETRYDSRACRRALRQRGLSPRSYHRNPSGARARLGRLRRRLPALAR
jgi:putative phosphoesterase